MADKGKRFNTKRKPLMAGAAEKEFPNQEFLLSLKHLDRSQGQTLSDWESSGMLSTAMETLRDYCSNDFLAQVGSKFTIYGDFPPKEKTEFTHPKHVPLDAQWARIHINGKVCVIGHVVINVFYVVFLDKDHKFWKSEKKHT